MLFTWNLTPLSSTRITLEYLQKQPRSAPETANHGDLMRLWVRTSLKINISLRFSRAHNTTPDTSKVDVLYQAINPISEWIFSRANHVVKKKRELSLGMLQASQSSLVLPHLILKLGLGILTQFSFWGWQTLWLYSHLPYVAELPVPLETTNSCTNAVHMKPFSTSVFKVLTWILATTTKICTRDCST